VEHLLAESVACLILETALNKDQKDIDFPRVAKPY